MWKFANIRKRLALAIFLANALGVAAAGPVELELARGKQALQPIVISSQASPSTEAVAAELADYLKRITGAEFKVQAGDGSRGLVLGTLAEFPSPDLAKPLEIRDGFNGKEAFAIRTEPKRILLIGATDLGASHAAFRFLEEIGCRWFFPPKEWEVVPSIPALRFSANLTERPAIPSRSIWFEAGSGGEQQNADYVAWKRHNRQAESFVVNAGHNLDAVIRANETEFKKHPEYLALTGGKRQGYQLELSNPAVRKMVVELALDFFDKNPTADMVSLEPADTVQHSESPESLAMGSVSDRVFGMANEAAKALQKSYPGKMVGLYSYNAHWDPPSFPLEPNVHVLLAGLGQGKFTPAERDALWPQRCHNLGFYEYYSVWLWSYDKLPGSWVNDIKGAREHVRGIVARGGTSVSAESTSSWGSNGRGYYLINKLMWNPELDVEAAAQDFYDKAFGPGAAAMKRYFERLDPGTRPFLSKHLLGLAFRDVDEASKKAADRPDVQARLDHIKQYLRYIHLDWMRNREAGPEDRKNKLSVDIMTSLFRTRGAVLTAWEMIRQNWGGNKNPGADHEPWMVDKPYTHEETEQEFQEGIEFFQPRQLGEAVRFSEDLVPISWAEASAEEFQVPTSQHYQGSAVYALYSFKGEPLEFETWAGDAWGGINRFVVTDAKKKEIAKGQPKNKKTLKHKIAVPAPGLYYLDYNDNGSYWAMTIEPGRVATIPLGSQRDYRNSKVMTEVFFYVPKGTKAVEYYYTRTAFHPGGPHRVMLPNGSLGRNVDVNGDWVSVPVPAGMDGKLWSIRDAVQGLFWFNNVPNYIAATPAGLMVPRELAIKDGLKILGP
jgi:hypothetical protein